MSSSSSKEPPPLALTPPNQDEGASFPTVTVGPRPGEDPPEPQPHVSEETKKNVEFNIRLCMVCFLFNQFAIAAVTAYISVYLSYCGFSNVAVGWISATEPIATLVLIQTLTYMIDKYHIGRLALTVASVVSSVLLLISLYLSHIPYSQPVSISTEAKNKEEAAAAAAATSTNSSGGGGNNATTAAANANTTSMMTVLAPAASTTTTNAMTTDIVAATNTNSSSFNNMDMLKTVSMAAVGALATNGSNILGRTPSGTTMTTTKFAASADAASVAARTATANSAAANNAARRVGSNTADQMSFVATTSVPVATVTTVGTTSSAPPKSAAATAAPSSSSSPSPTSSPSSSSSSKAESPTERDPPNMGLLAFVVVVMTLFKMPLICLLDHESMSILPPTEKKRYGHIRAFAGLGWGCGTAFFGFLQMYAGYGPCFTLYAILLITECIIIRLMRPVDLNEYDISIASFSTSTESFSMSATTPKGDEDGGGTGGAGDDENLSRHKHIHHHHVHHPHHHEHPPDETPEEVHHVMAEPVHFVYTRHQYDDETTAANNAAAQSAVDGQQQSPSPEAKAPPRFREVVKMVFVEKSMRRLAVHMFFLIIIGMGFAINQTFLFIFLQEDLNASQALLGLSVLITVFIEVPVLLYSDVIQDHLNDQVMFIMSMFSWFVRGFGYSFLTNPWYVLFLEPLHGVTFSFTWLSAVRAVHVHFSDELAASAFGLVHVCFAGAGPLIGLVVGGAAYDALGPRWFYRGAAFILLISCFAFYLLDLWAKKVEEKANEGKPKPTEEEEKQRKTNAVVAH